VVSLPRRSEWNLVHQMAQQLILEFFATAVTLLLFIVHTFGQVIDDPCLSGRCLTPMESRGRAVGQSQRDHRLLHRLLDARAVVEPTSSSISRHTRSRSPRCGQNELEIKREDSEAEEERRGTFLNKWEDDGQDLLEELESNDRMVFLLQEPHPSHRGRARCRAVNCIHGSYITDNYRICVDKGRSYNGKHYYHVWCSERMIDLKKLLPSKFKIDGPLWLWGLMIRQWFEHQTF